MPEIDGLINLLIQIPLVGIFIWFILERDKRQQLADDKRDDQWMSFLNEQRSSNNAAVARLAEEIKSIGQEVARLGSVLQLHDETSKQERLMRNTGALKEK